jgi:hypothetical protein
MLNHKKVSYLSMTLFKFSGNSDKKFLIKPFSYNEIWTKNEIFDGKNSKVFEGVMIRS